MSEIDKVINFYSLDSWLQMLDIVIIVVLFYQVFKFVRGTAAFRIFLGALAIYIIFKITRALKMELLSELLGQFIGVGFIALIVVFQQEIRRFLLLIASPRIYNRFHIVKWFFRFQGDSRERDKILVEPVAAACENLSKQNTGALIIISKEYTLDMYKSLGVSLDSEISQLLLEAIFQKESPLHDGAVIITGERILAARCVLPLSDRQDLPPSMGLRHRAAIGVTENSDATAIVVSEQNGSISVCNSGKFKENVSAKRLKELIRNPL